MPASNGSMFERVIGRLKRAAHRRDAEVETLENETLFFGLTFSIPEQFGGMTNVLLQRSAAFYRILGKPVKILTVDAKSDPARDEERLLASGHLGPGVSISNVWQDLRNADEQQLQQWFQPCEDEEFEILEAVPEDLEAHDSGVQRVEYMRGGTVEQVRFYRPDGTVCLLDDRSGDRPRMNVVNRKGRIIASYSLVRNFYFSWFDYLIDGRPAFIVNDSKAVGQYFFDYKRPNVLISQVLHSAHLDAGSDPLYGPLSRSRSKMIANVEQFDIFAILTERQKDEFSRTFGDTGNLAVLPNSREGSIYSNVDAIDRPAGAGIVVARLDVNKQIEHAIEAIVDVDAGSAQLVTLDIVGAGPHEESLREAIDKFGAADYVKLCGYTNDPRKAFREHSFTLMTSRYEGMSLVLVEAMAEGCVPIAYDIRFGPSDIIEDGVSGFLVEAGNREGLADTIKRFLELDESERTKMRDAAVERARAFSEEAIVSRWASAVDQAWSRKELMNRKVRRLPVPDHVEVSWTGPESLSIAAIFELAEDSMPEQLFFDIETQDNRYLRRVDCDVIHENEVLRVSASVPKGALDLDNSPALRLFVRQPGAPLRTRRLVTADLLGLENPKSDDPAG